MVRGPRSPVRAIRPYGAPVEPRAMGVLGAPPLPPAPRVSVGTSGEAAVAVRADVENPRLPPSGGRTHLRLTIVGGNVPPAFRYGPTPSLSPREPHEVWLYLDASGSMAGESIRAASAAAHLLVRRLRPYDRLAIVAYGERPRLLRAPRPIGDAIEAHRAIDLVVAGGGAPPGAPPPPARRGPRRGTELVLWVTDGAGFADARAPHVPSSAPVVTLVVGDSASAADLRALRASPGLDVRYVPDGRALGSAIGRALYAHRAAVAHDVDVFVSPAPGVRVVRAYGADPIAGGGVARRVPSLSRGDERVVLVELEVPAGVEGESVPLAEFAVLHRDRFGSGVERAEGQVRAVRARDGEEALATRDRGVARSVLAARSGAALASAGEALAREDAASARRLLEEQEELLAIAAASLDEAWIARDADVIGAYARMARHAPGIFDEGARQRVAARMVFEGDGRMRR